MKILAITDIHSNYDAARSAFAIESPDLILDCGDHEQIINLFGKTPHFYIRGNHEPRSLYVKKDEDPLPTSIPSGDIIEFIDENDSLTFTGIDGNYGSKQTIYQVNPLILDQLKAIDPQSIDILLLHESPLNVSPSSKQNQLAVKVMDEIERLKPKLVLSGHTNIFSEYISKNNVKFVNLDDMCNGYAIISVHGNKLTYERKRAFYGK